MGQCFLKKIVLVTTDPETLSRVIIFLKPQLIHTSKLRVRRQHRRRTKGYGRKDYFRPHHGNGRQRAWKPLPALQKKLHFKTDTRVSVYTQTVPDIPSTYCALKSRAQHGQWHRGICVPCSPIFAYHRFAYPVQAITHNDRFSIGSDDSNRFCNRLSLTTKYLIGIRHRLSVL